MVLDYSIFSSSFFLSTLFSTGWCCASVHRKFTWMIEVLKKTSSPEAIDGAAFDIEGLKATDYHDLFRTMRMHWNNTVALVKGNQVLRWYFGSELSPLVS